MSNALNVAAAEIPHALYRFYDDHDRLLYVGITLNPEGRWNAHNKDKQWWTSIVRATIEHHSSRTSAVDAEHAAIISERPECNVVHSRSGMKTLQRDELVAASAVYQDVNAAMVEARRNLHVAIREAASTMSESEITRVTGVTRMTVRKALGK